MMAGRGSVDGPGGGDNPVLNKLREQSAVLYRVSVSGSGDSTASIKVEEDILRRLREQLKQQKFDLQNRLGAGEISVDEVEYITVENLKEAVRQLVLGIENNKVSYYNKSLLLQRMQVFYNIQKTLPEKNADSEVLTNIANHSLNVASLTLKEQKESRSLEKQLNDTRAKRMALKEKSMALMTEVLSLVDELQFQKEPKEEKLKKIFKHVKRETDIAFMLQNIFQRLVHASRVNWVEDPKLREAVIKAGRDLHSF
ncbi:centromere protein H [Rana temporaria]|uniref:centromere protein H n=1 Tax=Rana temporaria TaxID=8407 RepID=UPI001AAD3C29|nr:centromere protein H [Rana temporaria]